MGNWSLVTVRCLVGQKERVKQIQDCGCKQNVVDPIVKIPVAKHGLVMGNR